MNTTTANKSGQIKKGEMMYFLAFPLCGISRIVIKEPLAILGIRHRTETNETKKTKNKLEKLKYM